MVLGRADESRRRRGHGPRDRAWSALSSLGSSVAGYGSQLAQSSGASSLYSAAANALQSGGEGGYLQSLGQQVPQGVELAGPQAGLTDAGPGFLHGFAQGFTGTMGQYAEPGAGTQFGQGLGMLGSFLDRSRGGVGGMDAGSLLRSALAQYGIGAPPTRPYSGPPPPQAQSGLFSVSLGGNIT